MAAKCGPPSCQPAPAPHPSFSLCRAAGKWSRSPRVATMAAAVNWILNWWCSPCPANEAYSALHLPLLHGGDGAGCDLSLARPAGMESAARMGPADSRPGHRILLLDVVAAGHILVCAKMALSPGPSSNRNLRTGCGRLLLDPYFPDVGRANHSVSVGGLGTLRLRRDAFALSD